MFPVEPFYNIVQKRFCNAAVNESVAYKITFVTIYAILVTLNAKVIQLFVTIILCKNL